MNDTKIRINKITLWDLKSVAHGVINLNAMDTFRQGKATIMGLYGQNASGKTVVVEALAIIKHIMNGQRIPPRYLDCIANGKDECSIEVEFLINNEDYDYTVIYKCTLAHRNDPNECDDNLKKILAVISESLRARGTFLGKKIIMQDIARTSEHDPHISPAEKRTVLFGTDQNVLRTLELQKVLALYGSRSFIFSSQAFDAMKRNARICKNENAVWPHMLIAYLKLYALNSFIVIDELAALNHDLYIVKKIESLSVPLKIPKMLGSDAATLKEIVDDIDALLPYLNNILSSIVPDLALEYKHEIISLDKGDDKYRAEFLSNRKELGAFPFKNESLGIKKIVSFIILIAEVYNNPSFTLAIDEIDASIFEYLLGEILDVVSASGKGQLIFTSHNLHPLERLDAQSVWFTTTDPASRYVQMSKKATNNLRNMYLRAIQIGHEDKELYSGDSKHALAYAFRKMGRRK